LLARRKPALVLSGDDLGVSWVFEEEPSGTTLVVTGEWSDGAGEALASGAADGLALNYARGFSAASLDFIRSEWKLRRLSVLDRSVVDLEPLDRLAVSLEQLSIQAAAEAQLDLHGFDRLRDLSAPWGLIAPTLGELPALPTLVTFEGFGEHDLRSLRDHMSLQRLTIKDARHCGAGSAGRLGSAPRSAMSLPVRSAPSGSAGRAAERGRSCCAG